MKEMIEARLKKYENRRQAFWDIMKEAVERKNLTEIINCVEELENLDAKEDALGFLLIDVVQLENKFL